VACRHRCGQVAKTQAVHCGLQSFAKGFEISSIPPSRAILSEGSKADQTKLNNKIFFRLDLANNGFRGGNCIQTTQIDPRGKMTLA
jgi:hypothetical protein